MWAASKRRDRRRDHRGAGGGFGLLVSPLAAIALVPSGFAIGLSSAGSAYWSRRAPSRTLVQLLLHARHLAHGALFGRLLPAAQLPLWARWFTWLLPSHAVSLCRAIASGHPGALALVNVAYVVVTTVVAFVLAERGVRKRVLV
jgi:hypothetical protein